MERGVAGNIMSETLRTDMQLGARLSPFRTLDKERFLTAEQLLSPEPSTTFGRVGIPLQQLSIKGLLSFGEETVFNFGQLNILIGPNGAGKSNLLNCIRVLRLAPLDIQQAFQDSGFEDWLYKGDKLKSASLQAKLNVPEPIRHQIRFSPQSGSRATLEEVISHDNDNEPKDPLFIGSHRGEASLSAIGKRRRVIRKLTADEYNPFSSILAQIRDAGQYPEITRLAALYSQFRIYSEWTFGRTSKLRESTPTNRTTATLSESMDDLALILNGLEKTAAHQKIRELLRELKETYVDYITRILFGRVGLEILESPFESPLPSQRLSDGTLRFLALAAILFQPTPPPLICLEEPELGMHPDMIRMVASMIVDASSRTQLIVTTHSEFLLTSLQDDFNVIFTFDAGINGSIVRQLSQEEFSEWREEHTLGELWTSGELGGNRW
jgi:predicted ATPase